MGNIVTCLCEYKSNLQMVTLIKSLVEQHGTVQCFLYTCNTLFCFPKTQYSVTFWWSHDGLLSGRKTHTNKFTSLYPWWCCSTKAPNAQWKKLSHLQGCCIYWKIKKGYRVWNGKAMARYELFFRETACCNMVLLSFLLFFL